MIGITIGGVDKTSIIDQQSVRYSQTLSKEPSTATFSVTGAATKPTVGQAIVVTLDSQTFFTGTIVSRNETLINNGVPSFEYKCLDRYFDMDRRLVAKAFSDTTLGAVASFIIANFTTGLTLNVPATTPTIKTVRFNYEEPSRCIQKLCDAVGWDWHIDPDGVINIYQAGETIAPFTIDDSNTTDEAYVTNSLEFNRNIIELKNTVYVRGGEYLDPISEEDAVDKYEANGTDNTFPLVYRYNSVQITRNGIPQDVGVDFINDIADYDCLYNFSEKLVRFADGTLVAGDIIRIFGNAYVPLIVQAVDTDSIVAYGEREGIEINKSINSIEEAESLANAILDKWREGSKEGSFMSYKTGWHVGQTVHVVSALSGIDDYYKVNRVSAQMHGYDDFKFTVEFIKSGQTTFTDLMISLIGKEKNNISIGENEVLQKFRKVAEELGVTDEITDTITSTPPYQYVGEGASSEVDYFFQDSTDFLFQDNSDLVFISSSGSSGANKYNFSTYSSGTM